MNKTSAFPNSARAAWLLRNSRGARPPRITPEVRECRLLAKELARDLREVPLDKLLEVAKLLGRSPKWLEMVRMESHQPGLVGRACLRSIR